MRRVQRVEHQLRRDRISGDLEVLDRCDERNVGAYRTLTRRVEYR
jgi:hypothetical protein